MYNAVEQCTIYYDILWYGCTDHKCIGLEDGLVPIICFWTPFSMCLFARVEPPCNNPAVILIRTGAYWWQDNQGPILLTSFYWDYSMDSMRLWVIRPNTACHRHRTPRHHLLSPSSSSSSSSSHHHGMIVIAYYYDSKHITFYKTFQHVVI